MEVFNHLRTHRRRVLLCALIPIVAGAVTLALVWDTPTKWRTTATLPISSPVAAGGAGAIAHWITSFGTALDTSTVEDAARDATGSRSNELSVDQDGMRAFVEVSYVGEERTGGSAALEEAIDLALRIVALAQEQTVTAAQDSVERARRTLDRAKAAVDDFVARTDQPFPDENLAREYEALVKESTDARSRLDAASDAASTAEDELVAALAPTPIDDPDTEEVSATAAIVRSVGIAFGAGLVLALAALVLSALTSRRVPNPAAPEHVPPLPGGADRQEIDPGADRDMLPVGPGPAPVLNAMRDSTEGDGRVESFSLAETRPHERRVVLRWASGQTAAAATARSRFAPHPDQPSPARRPADAGGALLPGPAPAAASGGPPPPPAPPRTSRVPILFPPEASMPPPPAPPDPSDAAEVSDRRSDGADAVSRGRRRRASFVNAPLVLLGALMILGASMLSWSDLGSDTARAFDVPARFLLDRAQTERSGVSIGALLLVAGGLAIVGSLARKLRLLAVLGGVAVLVMTLLFTWRMRQVVDAVSSSDDQLVDVLGAGVSVALAGGIVTIVGAVLTFRKRAPS
jgi:hypothetical protein